MSGFGSRRWCLVTLGCLVVGCAGVLLDFAGSGLWSAVFGWIAAISVGMLAAMLIVPYFERDLTAMQYGTLLVWLEGSDRSFKVELKQRLEEGELQYLDFVELKKIHLKSRKVRLPFCKARAVDETAFLKDVLEQRAFS